MKTVAVVLNFRRADDTIACVRSLKADAPGLDVIVVDNASGDGSAEAIGGALGAEITLMRSGGNLGYAGGNNVGIARALERDAGRVLVLNNDLVVEPGFVTNLTKAQDEHEWGIAGPLSLLEGDDDVVDFFAGRVLLDHGALLVPGRDQPRGDKFREPRSTEYVTGSAMLIRREVLERAGTFDERFFLVWEDVDLSLRARDAGFRLGVTPDAVVRHKRSVSFGGDASPLQRYFFVRNPYLLVRKHVGRPKRWLVESRITRRYRTWSRDRDADPRVSSAIALGMRHGLRGRFGPPPPPLMP